MGIYIHLRKIRLIFGHAPVILGFLTESYLAKLGVFTKRGMDIQGRSDYYLFGHAPVIFGHGPVIFKFLTGFYLAKLWDLCLANMISQELVRRIFISSP